MTTEAKAPFVPKDAIPETPEELEELLNDTKRMQDIVGDPEAHKDFLKKYDKAVNNKRPDLKREVDDAVQKGLRQFLIDNGVNRPDVTGNLEEWESKNVAYNKRAAGSALDKEFKDTADFMASIWHGAKDGGGQSERWRKIRNDYSSIDPASGGFLVPEVLRSELLRLALETSLVRPRARIVPMDSARVPFPKIDDTSHASSVYGGIVGSWTQQGASISETEATFGQTVLDAKKLAAYCEVPNELLQDSITSFAALVDSIYPEAIAWFEDDAFLTGTGVGEPLGITNASAVVSVDKEDGQPADTIVWENLVKMYARQLPASQGRAVWIANNNVFPELATMALSVGTGGSAIWLNNGQSGPPATILGRPLLLSEKLPTLGDANDIMFVDFGYYLVGDRQMMRAESSPHVKFQNDMTAYRVTERVDGRPWIDSAITPKAGDSLSPFVGLAARA